ncbi:MAG: WYL domain-containing protein [gamma proteobacterium symbiont of Lucinoma myriamae]|nr:WYL domain-containing protein [gamma proteobacterium symbiont of Lucinoma myriamae]
MYQTIKSAAYNYKTVLIVVRKENGKVVTREIEPYYMKYEKGKLYLFCWDRTKNGIRKFRSNRIFRAIETANSFIPKCQIKI